MTRRLPARRAQRSRRFPPAEPKRDSLGTPPCSYQLANALQSVFDGADSRTVYLDRLLAVLANFEIPQSILDRLVTHSVLSAFLSRVAAQHCTSSVAGDQLGALVRLAAAGRLEELRVQARSLSVDRSVSSRPLSESVRAALRTLDAEFHRPNLDLRAVSRLVRVSRCHLSRRLNIETGVTFYEHLRCRRVRKAFLLITSTRLSIKEITGAAGYSTCSQLDRHFKSSFGFTPSECRRVLTGTCHEATTGI